MEVKPAATAVIIDSKHKGIKTPATDDGVMIDLYITYIVHICM